MSEQMDTSAVNQPLMQEEEYKGTISINKTKSDYTLDLSSADSEYNHACCIGWDFFDLWGKKKKLAITVIALDEYSLEMEVTVYNEKENILNDSVIHSKRNLYSYDSYDVNDNKHDDESEKIEINLKNIPLNCKSLWFLVNGKFEDVESANFKLYNANNIQIHSYSALLSGYNPTAMLLGVLWKHKNGIDWNYDSIEQHGDGINYKQSKSILIKCLSLVYSNDILKRRPNDKSKQYELDKSESYIIDPSINKITLGLGWDPSEYGNIDVDASVIVFDKINNELKLESIVGAKYNLWYNDNIKHFGDSGSGKGKGDDEKIDMFLNKMNSSKIDILCVMININSGASSFISIKNCFARLIDDKNNELCKFKLSDGYDTCGIIMCTINKQINGCWCLNTIGIGVGGRNAKSSMDAAKKICMGYHLTDNDKQTHDCCCVIL